MVTVSLLRSRSFKDLITNFDLQQKIIDTYRKLDDYQVHKTVNIHDTVGAVSQKSKHEVNIALDRSNKSIAIWNSQLKIVAKDNTLKSTIIPSVGTHVQIDNINPLDPVLIQKNWPMFPILLWTPDLSLYFGTEIQLFLKRMRFNILPVGKDDPQDQTTLELKLPKMDLRLTIDNDTSLIRHAVLTMRGLTPEEEKTTSIFDIQMQYSQPNKWESDLFTIDTTNSRSMPSLKALIEDAHSTEPLLDKVAPHFALKTLNGNVIDSNKLKTKVVVLDFWSTTCGPCKASMPYVIKLNQWAQDNNLDVTVLTINQKEDPELVQEFIDKQGWTLPVLLDDTGNTTAMYRAYSIPQTVIIVDGKIQRIFQGFSPRIADAWREEIATALGVNP